MRIEHLLWIALAVCLSAVGVDLFRSLGATDRSLGILLAPALLLRSWQRGLWVQRGGRRRGLALIGVGALAEFVGFAGGSASIARLALPTALCGAADFAGRPPVRVAALSLWLIPTPSSVVAVGTPGLESMLAWVATLPYAWLGLPVSLNGPLVQSGALSIELSANDAGIPLAVMLAGVGWYAGLCRTRGWLGLSCSALAYGLWAVPLQVLAVSAATGLFLGVGPEAARLWLEFGVLLVAAIVALAWAECRSKESNGDRFGLHPEATP